MGDRLARSSGAWAVWMLRLEPRLTEVRTLAFSPDNRYLLAVGVNPLIGGLLRFARVALWDLSDPAARPRTGIDEDFDPKAGFFLPDGRVLGVDNRGLCRAGRPGGGAEPFGPVEVRTHRRVEPAAVSPDGRWLALIGRGDVEGRPLGAGPERSPWRLELDPGYEATGAAFSPGSEVVAVAILGRGGVGPPAAVGIYDADTGGRAGWIAAEDVFCARWSPDAGSVAAVRQGGFVVHDLYTRAARTTRLWTRPRLTAAEFHPSGRTFMTADEAGQVHLWDTGEWGNRVQPGDADRPPTRTLDWGVGAIQALALSRDGTLGAVAGRRGEVVVWDADE